MYFDAKDGVIDCSSFVAVNNKAVEELPSKTRGAYNVLVDLVTALCSDLSDGSLKYTLLVEEDLELSPALAKVWEDSRATVRKMGGTRSHTGGYVNDRAFMRPIGPGPRVRRSPR
jgi:hypothetical protein